MSVSVLDESGLAVEEVPWRDPESVFARVAHEPFAMWLDSASPDPLQSGRWSIMAAEPFDKLIIPDAAAPGADPFGRLKESLARPSGINVRSSGISAADDMPPFCGGAMGLFGYELAHALEHLPRLTGGPATPDMAVGFYDTVLSFDHATRRAFVSGDGSFWRRHLAAAGPLAAPLPGEAAVSAAVSRADYESSVRDIIAAIHGGDVFQANISQNFTAPGALHDAFSLYRRLRRLSPAPFASFMNLGDAAVISASPERFVWCRGGRAETRPIKGTRPRGDTPGEDDDLARQLTASAKDRAENIMIVDLLRNDLSKVAADHSVKVEALCQLVRFAKIHHLMSILTARLSDGMGPVDLLKACFPGGSVTGAPKIRAMELIAEQENERRGPYCGAMGYIGFDGAMDTSIAIRTITMESDRMAFRAGGGVVADSDPAAEYDETITKARAMMAAAGFLQKRP